MHPAEIGLIQRFDLAVDRAFDQVRATSGANRLFYTLSELGDFSLIWHLVGSSRGLLHDDGFSRAVRLSTILGVESAIVNGVLKSVFRRQRPVTDIPRPLRLRQPRTSSFPSGHASAGFTAATLLADDSRYGAAWYALAGLVAVSRIHVRIHHASDVVGGIGVGLVLGHLARRAWPVPPSPRRA